MPQRPVSLDRVADQAHAATQQMSPWIERLGRLGYAAKGIVYGLIGVLAVQATLGASSGQTTGSQGALQRIAQGPFGQIAVSIIAVGLIGYALWRLVQAALDTEHKGADARGILTRGAYVLIGLIYAGLALSALQLAFGSGGGGDDGTAQGWTARLMAQPFGRWLVGLAGAIVISVGLYQLYRAYSAKFREKLKLHEMNSTEETWAVRIGRLGYAARGVVFGIMGGFLIVAAVQAQPEAARGLGGALETLAQQPAGSWLLRLVAVGLLAYGVFMLVEARYRRMVIR